jgi:monovalent cation:H+ antiporter-2, CPA2 family
MEDLPLLLNIAVALGVALLGGLAARRLGLPTIVGYLLAGVAIGPFTPGFVGDVDIVSQLAELGVIFLMFGVGLQLALKDLWQVRGVVVPGALTVMAITITLSLGLSRLWGWPLASGLVLGLALSISSTVVLMRGVMDNALLNTRHGQVAVSWTVLEDLATVLILVLLPSLAAGSAAASPASVGLALLRAALFVVLMLFVGMRLVPWLLQHIAFMRSRELFILVVIGIALGTASGATLLFGVSLALGAFLAGVVVSESPVSYQVAADVLPFREAFAVLFFVSVGMLVNPAYLLANAGQVAALTALIVAGKALAAALIGFLFPYPARTALVLAAGVSQIGEFSFIVGQAGLSLGVLNRDQYSLILAGALLSITINPFMYRLINPVEAALRRFPRLWQRLDRHGPPPSQPASTLSRHVVVVGWGRVGHHIVDVLGLLGIPHLVMESDPGRVEQLERLGVPALFGDAGNSELLRHANLPQATALVVTLPQEAAAESVVAGARQLAPGLPIVARAATQDGVTRLAELGAQDVIHPELEGGLEIVRHTLLRLGYPMPDVQRYVDLVRRDHYDLAVNTPAEQQMLRQLMDAVSAIEVTWFRLPAGNPLAGQSIAEANIRARTGASIIALYRDGQVLPNPKSQTVLQAGDRLGLIGEPEQIAHAEALFELPAGELPQAGPAGAR